ncbi:MAG: hypothetical protein Q7W45_10830 [Bacteroidota bacterium]|nr:hypothetical protein [Bacteroidota bacterium]MDP3146051.1 hypothetical protein [Bacteroidota bacterium]
MLSYLKISIVILPFLFFNNNEKVKKEIIEINKAYFLTTTIGVDVTTTAYNVTQDKLIQTSKMSITKAPGKYLIINGNNESMANMDYKINIHHEKKIIIVTKLTEKTPYEKKPDVDFMNSKNFGMNLDTVMDFYKELKLTSLNESDNELYFEFKSGKINQSKVIYNKTNFKINYVEIFTSVKEKKYKYVIKYNYKPTNTVTKKCFDERNYFTINKSKIILNPSFANYKLTYNK